MTEQTVKYGDCRKVLPTLTTGTFSLCLTDPPYRVSNWKAGFGPSGLIYNTEPPEYREWLWETKRVLKGTGQIVIFESSYNLHRLYDALEQFGFVVKQTGIWHVSNRSNYIKGPMYRNHMDVWVWAVKSPDEYSFHYERGEEPMSDVWKSPNVRSFGERVPGIKPLDFMERFVLVHTEPDDWVLDPFLGSGTTLLACRRTGRNGLGIEIRGELQDVIERRLMTKVGLEPFLKEGKRVGKKKTPHETVSLRSSLPGPPERGSSPAQETPRKDKEG